ncbi:anti-sigma factor [Modestobacter sp. NPDC049651]|uniref:anti-sigma factor domain-containing protein n=1 Tax=unclassified Modestobacter TaxID=2643866 RepID=UPI0034034D37
MSAPTGRPGPAGHEQFEELAVGWALHALEPEDEALFAAHLGGCAQCTRTVADTQEVMAALASDLPEAEPSDGLRDRLRAAVEETEQQSAAPPSPVPPAVPSNRPSNRPSTPPAAPRTGPARPSSAPVPGPGALDGLHRPRPPRDPDLRPAWRRVLPGALVAAAVAAILALGTWNVVIAGDRDAAEATAARQEQVLRAVLQDGPATVAPLSDPEEPDGPPVATVVARRDGVQVVSNGLAVNDQRDAVYVLWGIGDESPVALGTFDVVSPRIDLRTVGSSAAGSDDFDSYGISREPGRQAPSAPTDIVATGQVTS